jgi:pimeloyl-ACP methyl ester carboxylesterase
MTRPAPIILVPGFWLGAWAWDEVAATLRAGGHDVTALTLPGLESADADRSKITMADHVEAIAGAVRAAGRPVVLAVHSGTGASGYLATDRVPDDIAAVVYVDSAPASGALDPDFAEVEKPLAPTWEELGENLDGLSEEQLVAFRARAVPEPGAAISGWLELTDERRLDLPSVVLCTSASSADMQSWIKGGYSWLGGLAELRDVRYVDLPTSHWPMWSKPAELAELLAETAVEFGSAD